MKLVQPIKDSELLEKVKRELMHSSYRNWLLFIMGINTGLRIGDLRQLRVCDVLRRSHIYIREGKTKKLKRFMINEQLQDIIENYCADKRYNDYLFPSQKTGKPILSIQCWRIINGAAGRLGIPEIGCHSMRKTFGYHHYKKFQDVAILQKIFNHSSPEVTLRYIGVEQDEIDATIQNFHL